MDVRAGMLLVATPELAESSFAASVVLLLDANDEGALGVILNRPTRTPVSEVLPDWVDLGSPPGVFFQGGPVSLDSAIAVGRLRDPEPAPLGWQPVTGNLGIVDLDTPTDLIRDALSGLRIFAGYAGWGAGQLQGELAEGSWYLVPSRLDDVFGQDTEGLRTRVLRRQPGQLAWQATRPVNPNLN